MAGIYASYPPVFGGGGGGGGGSSTSIVVTQVAHGFVAGDILYYTGTVYAKAKADASTTVPAIGIVSSVLSANVFLLTTEGYISGLSGLVAGSVYFVSTATAGAATATEPSALGQFVQQVYVAISTTEAIIEFSRALGVAQSVVLTAITGVTVIGATTNLSMYTFTTASSYNITLPAANAATSGRRLSFKEISGTASTNPVTFVPAGADQIEGVAASLVYRSNYGALEFRSDGSSKWWVY